MTSKLMKYNTENAAPEIRHRRVHRDRGQQALHGEVQAGYKFHDGTDVKAKNFVDAWNYTAFGPNGQAGSYFYAPIAGYADTQCPDPTGMQGSSRRPRP